MQINSLAVFCGSKNGNNPIYAEQAAELGRLMAANNISLIYGGSKKGIMGALADTIMTNGGKVIGVIPRILVGWEHQHDGITELLIVDDMHVRKRKMYELCDAALILPGGFGTLDEMFELITWNQLAIHDKPIFVLNSEGFYDHLIQHMIFLEQSGFLYEPIEKKMKFLKVPADLFDVTGN
jgi:uncharacterized protein (TIGR00730 family)